MNQIVRNSIYIISGLPGSWKSFFASFLASAYPIIYSNLELKRWSRIISNKLAGVDDVERVPFHSEKWLIVIEEAGVNASSRRSLSKDNEAFTRLGMLGRKKNKDIIIIAQLSRTIDVILRDLAQYTWEMDSWFIDNGKLLFSFTVRDRNQNILGTKEIDLTFWAEEYWFSYSTLEESVIREYRKKWDSEN